MKQLSQSWNLDTLYPGGSKSPELQTFLQKIDEDIALWSHALKEMTAPTSAAEASRLLPVIEAAQDLDARLEEASDFAICLEAQDTGDTQAKRVYSQAIKLRADYDANIVLFDELLLQTPDDVWSALIEQEAVKPISYYLGLRRANRQHQMSAELEMLAADLAVDGHHAWESLHSSLISSIRVPFEQEGEVKQLSIPQVSKNTMSPDRDLRKRAAEAIEGAIEDHKETITAILNHAQGFLLQLVKHRGEQSPLPEAVRASRITEQTLRAMWDTIEANLSRLTPYFERKAKLLGLEKLSWYDLNAPVSQSEKKVGYEEVMSFILEQFGRFSPALRDYVQKALDNNWLDVADKAEKRGGAFCAYFPNRGQQRIFYTLSGYAYDITVLAHELGHGFHAEIMADQPYFAQRFSTNLAETASTFGEMVAADAALQHAETKEERINLLHNRIQNIVLYLVSVNVMFRFEEHYYEERKKGLVPSERITEMYEAAYKQATHDVFENYASKQWLIHGHLYDTKQAFYNFQYTFGYLFSTGIYVQALKEGPAFADRYVALLRDTGSMSAEELAQKHLGVDLTQPEFWQSAIDHVMTDIDEFLKLTE